MGGAATVCIQYTDGARDSYMAYNKGMCFVPNNSYILSASPDKIDEVAKEVYKRESASSVGEYFEDSPGLAPVWYGINFIDLGKKRIWQAQGQNDITTYFAPFLNDFYADDYAENLRRLSENGWIYVTKDMEDYCKFCTSNATQGFDVVTPDQIDRAVDGLAKKDEYYYFVRADGWEYRSFHDPTEELYELIKAEYELTGAEQKIWAEFLEERGQ